MSLETYAAMPFEQLLRLFAEMARQVGLGRGCRDGGAPSGASAPSKAEKKRAFAEAQTIASVLHSKATKRQVEPLFEGEDPDVRLCAALLFGDLAPELAEAAQNAVIAGCSTQEMMAQAQRARTPPPPRPILPEMGDDALLERFQDAGERLSACRFIDALDNPKDFEARDHVVEELAAIRAEIERRGMLAKLEPFLDSKDPRIRFQAALGCLRIAPEKAVAALEALTQNADPGTQISASMALQRQRAGDLDRR